MIHNHKNFKEKKGNLFITILKVRNINFFSATNQTMKFIEPYSSDKKLAIAEKKNKKIPRRFET